MRCVRCGAAVRRIRCGVSCAQCVFKYVDIYNVHSLYVQFQIRSSSLTINVRKDWEYSKRRGAWPVLMLLYRYMYVWCEPKLNFVV